MPYTSDWKAVDQRPCPHCESVTVQYRLWESFDEAHEDVEYQCTSCNHIWWYEGVDS